MFLNLLCFKFDKFILLFVCVQLKNYGHICLHIAGDKDIMHHCY